MTTVFYAWLYDSFIEIQSNVRRKKLHWTNRDFNFLGGGFNNRVNKRAPIQLRIVRIGSQSQHLKTWFFCKSKSIPFHTSSTSVIIPVKQNQLSFSTMKSTSHFLILSTVSCRSALSSEANASFCRRSDAWSHLEKRVVSTESNITRQYYKLTSGRS